MVAVENILIALSVIVGSATIPFVNDPTMAVVDNFNEGLEPVLNRNVTLTEAKKYPGTISSSFGPDALTFVTETAFGTFSVNMENKDGLRMSQRVDNEDVSVERFLKNDGVLDEVWVIRTRNYTLASTKNFTTVSERFSDPHGSCTKIQDSGTVKEVCSGQLFQIEDGWNKARKHLQEYVDVIQKTTNEIKVPDIVDDSNAQWTY